MGQGINRDTVVAIALLVLCGVFFTATFDIRETTYATIGAEVWPRLILVLLFVLSAIYLFQSVRRTESPADQTQAEPGGGLGRFRNALWCYVLFALFLLTLPWLGMLIGGILFVFGALTAMGERTARAFALHAAIAIGTIGTMWAIFTYGLRVILPEGVIFSAW
ncbi:MAG: tripartite tricarboxylate transporter TctB family protein [Pseudomonadota bacterium]